MGHKIPVCDGIPHQITCNIGTKVFTTALLFSTIWANSAEDKLMIFFLFFPENRFVNYFFGDNLYEMSKHVFWKKKFKKLKCHY